MTGVEDPQLGEKYRSVSDQRGNKGAHVSVYPGLN